MMLWGIDTRARQAAFLAQVAHESGGLFYHEEIASGAAYEGRRDLGNTQPGDGRRYKGRGLIQITGRANYRSATAGIRARFHGAPDFEADPIALGQAPWCVHGACWFWSSRTVSLNRLADEGTHEAFTRMTKVINGGYNGIDDRRDLWAGAKRALGVV